MEGPPLDPNELEAIRNAIRESASQPDRRVEPLDEEVTPLSLIADDRAAENARPAGMKIAERWARLMQPRLRHLMGGDPEVNPIGAELIDGSRLRDDLLTMWTQTISPEGRPGHAIVAIGGPLIEMLGARLLGASAHGAAHDRPPTRTAIRLFGPVGATIVDSLCLAWREDQQCDVDVITDPRKDEAIRRSLMESDLSISIGLSVSGVVNGHIQCIAKPETFVAPPTPLEAVPAPPGAIDQALGSVPIEVRVDFGKTRLRMEQIKRLQVGTVLSLGQFIDDPLPIECAGVVKGYGRAVVYRGVLAVEVTPSARKLGAVPQRRRAA
jgi:flagellar motor switch protein FliM